MAKACTDLLSLPTETLVEIIGYLPAYDKLCVRITCKRLHSVVSDSRVWECMVWRGCRRSEKDFKALRLALRLAHYQVRNVVISYPYSKEPFALSKFLPQVHNCKQLCSLMLTGMPVTLSALNKALVQLPSLQSLSISPHSKLSHKDIMLASAGIKQLTHLCLQNYGFYPHFNLSNVVQDWKLFNYNPSNLCVHFAEQHFCKIQSGVLTSSDHPAFLFVHNITAGPFAHKYPLLEISLHPTVQVVSLDSRSICSTCPDTSCVILTRGKSDQYTGATYCQFEPVSPLCGPKMTFLPITIKYLCLASMSLLSSDELTLVSKSCPNLECLNIQGCAKVLLVLQGLGDIGSNCPRLNSLNLMGIMNVESIASVWEVLAGMNNLRHLAVGECLCCPNNEPAQQDIAHCPTRIRASASHLKLFTFEISLLVRSAQSFQLDLFLPAFSLLQQLRLSTSTFLDMTNILPSMPNLTGLYISCSQYHAALTLPTDPACYSSLTQIYISSKSSFTYQHMEAFSKKLTHLYLDVLFSDLNVYLGVIRFPCLCECYINLSHSHSAPSLTMKMKDFGMCGAVSGPHSWITSSLYSRWHN